MEEKNFFDFRTEDDFDLNSEYTKVFGTENFIPKNPGESKLEDAEKIINELGGRYIEGLSLKKYEVMYINLLKFLDKFKTESEAVTSMSKADRDKLFGYGKEMFQEFQGRYGKLDFNFELSIDEWHYIYNTLTRKMSYDGKEIFNYWELYKKFLEPTNEMAKQLPTDLESFIPICSIESLILLSHLLMKWEEKGSTKSFYHFQKVLTEIAQMTKLFNAYGVVVERITNRFNHWVDALNAMDGYNNDERVG